MSKKLEEIEGVGPKYASQLKEWGVNSQEQLLEKCAQKKGRKELSGNTGISEKLILSWANRADLARVKGVGEEYADLLEHAGVDTVPELAQRKPENLFAKMLEVNEEKNLVRSTPSEDSVKNWVAQAKDLPRVIEY